MTAYRVLVVDDDPVHREVTGEYLSLAGYDVATATGGREALELLHASPPDVVLLDVQMPELDGFAVFQRMRDDVALRDIPVLFLSNLQASHVKVRGLELGAEDYIAKSSPPAELLARVRAGLRRAGRYQRLQGLLVGDLGVEPGLDALLQTLQIGMRPARIRLVDLPAEVECAYGVIRACRYLGFEGLRALERVLFRARGRFVVESLAAASDTAEALGLMEAVVAVDEARIVLSSVSTPGAIVALAAPPVSDEALERRRHLFPLPLEELVASLDGELRAAAVRVAGALGDGTITLA